MDSYCLMIRRDFLDPASRKDLIALARGGSAAHRLGRRANALVLLDQGMSCSAVAKVLLLDDDTIRIWHRLYQEDGIEGLAGFGHAGSACRLSAAQQGRLVAWVTATLPCSTRAIGAWIELHFVPAYCPHLNPIERLWGVMHKHVTHNRCHASFNDFVAQILTFLRIQVRQRWNIFVDQVSDNFRVIRPENFRVIR